METEEDRLIEMEIQRRQEVLDKGWKKPRQKYINGYPVGDKEYWEYMEERRIEDAKADAELSFYRKCTSTGEEWEIDSDGMEYIP